MSQNRLFEIGVDWGQKQDNSAVCLVELYETKAVVKLLVKYDLGSGYPHIAETLRELYYNVCKEGTVQHFNSDATGVGTEPTRMLQELIPDARIDFFIFTNKSKRELVGKVKVMHSLGRLKFAKKSGDEMYNRTLQDLITEMKQLQMRVIKGEDSNPEIEVFKTGAHDDLFTALALAVKDVNISKGADVPVGLVEDKTWVRTPLTEEPSREISFF